MPRRIEGVTTQEAFTVHTVDTAPEGARPGLSALRERIGLIPDLAATMAAANRVADVCDPPVDEAFQAQAWG